jgi:alkanesulfonate monooxygenase SsuD/methylene tetrahydromethanopterin reductase-like flavin-dependent oxidoreductase (luciferase family)
VETIRRLEAESARPDPLRIVATVLTSPGLDAATTDEIVRARALTYLQIEGLGDSLQRINGWEPGLLQTIRSQLMPDGTRRFVDMHMTRSELAQFGQLVPESWIEAATAVGSVQRCAQILTEYWNAGADEVLVHSALPGQCEELVAEVSAVRTAP